MFNPCTEFHFYFMRHGESVAQLRPELVGGRQKETVLTTRGFWQAEQLGRRLNTERAKFNLIYSSTLPRAIQTCERVCNLIRHNFNQVIKTEKLIEISHGDWETQERNLVHTPDVLALMNFQNPWFTPPNGESRKEVQIRMSEWLLSVLRDPHLSGCRFTIGVFSHGLALGCLFQSITGLDSMTARIWFDNCSISRLRFDRFGWHVDCLNDTGHLSLTP